MPLNSRIIRNGEPLEIKWSEFAIASMIVATMFEHSHKWMDAQPNEDIREMYPETPQPLGPGDTFQIVNYGVIGAVMPEGEYTLEHPHAFEDTSDGEVLRLEKGDVLKLWRD